MEKNHVKLDIRRELSGVLSPAASFDGNWRKLCWLKQQGADAAEVQPATKCIRRNPTRSRR